MYIGVFIITALKCRFFKSLQVIFVTLVAAGPTIVAILAIMSVVLCKS